MTTEINSSSQNRLNDSPAQQEPTLASRTEATVNQIDLFQLPSEVVNLTLRRLRPYELNQFQQANKTSEQHTDHLKIAYAQEFGYESDDLEGSRKFLRDIYQEVVNLKGLLPSAFDAEGKFDPESTLRNLQTMSIEECFAIFNHIELKIYEPEHQKTRKYLLKIAGQLFSKMDTTLYKTNMKEMMQSAIKGSDVPTMALLLKHGVDIEDIEYSIHPHKVSALLMACHHAQSLDVFEFLLSHGADIHARYANRSDVFYMLNQNRARNSEFSLSVAKLLLSRGANPNVGDSQGKTPLHHAIEKQDLPFIDLLLKYGANLQQPNNAGQTPFALALKSWNLRIVNMCLLGFDPYAEDEL